MASLSADIGRQRATPRREASRAISWGLVLLICAIACIGFAMLYSAAERQHGTLGRKADVRGLRSRLILHDRRALIDIRHWFRVAYWLYGIALALIVAVDLRGVIGMGAQRWIDLGVIQLQPSELMKIALMLGARALFSLPRRARIVGALLAPDLRRR